MNSSIFVVVDEPWCIWESDVRARSLEFLRGLDVEYFNYLLQGQLTASDEKRAAVAVRIALHHGTETLFSLVGALLQAPHCPYGWISKCSNRELGEFVQRVSDSDASLFSYWKGGPPMGWPLVANCVFQGFSADATKREQVGQRFARFWSRMAAEFADANHIDEYNAMKHGFRVRPGGFTLAFGAEHKYGVAPPAGEMHVLGGSPVGSSFLKLERVGDVAGTRSLRSRRVSLNWSPERITLQLQLVAVSIQNLVSALKIANGAPGAECRFEVPQEEDAFDRPWTYSTGITSSTLDDVLDERAIPALSKQDLMGRIAGLEEGRQAGNV